MSPEEVAELRRKIADRKEARARAQGAVEQLESQLASEFGIHSEEEAQTALASLESDIAALDGKITSRRTAIDAALIEMGL